MFTEQPGLVELRETHARLTLRENVARKRFRMVFHNTNTVPQTEAFFLMELEPDQKVDGFKVKVAGKETEAELLDADKARKIYEEIVAKKKDPALLEHYGSRLLRIRIFPIPPQSTFEVEIETIETLRAENGLVRVQTLHALPSSFTKPLVHATLEATISSSKGVKSVFSPTHTVDVLRKDDREAQLRFERKNYVPAGPLTFYYTIDERPLSATLIAAAEPGEDGAFMLTITPPAAPTETAPRDIVFLVDTSGSMNENGKMAQARAALKKLVEGLSARDQFNIVTFSTEAQKCAASPLPGSAEAKKAAVAWIDALRARGGTHLEGALALAHLEPRPGAVPILVLLSDGAPTIGERDTAKLAALARSSGARLFSIGLGFEVQTQLLDRLALDTGGDRLYVRPNEDLSLVLDGFARKIGPPILADVALALGEGVSEVHPKRLPDLFTGGELVVFGRFKGDGRRTVELTGTAGGKRVLHRFEVPFTPDARHDFVPRLWAIQKVDYLIDQLRQHGDSKEVVDHIVEIAKRYGIVTPYTSFLMTEDVPHPTAAGRVRDALKVSQENRFVGSREVFIAGNQAAWRGAYDNEKQILACNEALGRGAEAVAQTVSQQRQVGARTLFCRNGSWVDSAYGAQTVRNVKFASGEYFQLLQDNPEASRSLALGTNVVFWNRTEWVRVEG